MSNAEAHAWLSLAFRKALVNQMDAAMLNALSTASKALADLSRIVEIEAELAEAQRAIVDISARRSAS